MSNFLSISIILVSEIVEIDYRSLISTDIVLNTKLHAQDDFRAINSEMYSCNQCFLYEREKCLSASVKSSVKSFFFRPVTAGMQNV